MDYVTIVSSLIPLLIDILESALRLDNCDGLYSLISRTIDTALSGGIPRTPQIPALLLSLSDKKGGYSVDTAYMEAMQRVEAVGVNTGTINGEANKLHDVVKGMLDAQWFTQKTKGYSEGTNKEIIIPMVPPLIIPPGLIRVVSQQR
jgi:hypothetical protein